MVRSAPRSVPDRRGDAVAREAAARSVPGSGRTAAGSREAEAMSRVRRAPLRDPREWRWLVCEKGRACAFTTFDLLGTRAAKGLVIAGGRSLSYTHAAAVTNGWQAASSQPAASRAPH
jgi:hypothetical protein